MLVGEGSAQMASRESTSQDPIPPGGKGGVVGCPTTFLKGWVIVQFAPVHVPLIPPSVPPTESASVRKKECP
jgi:hypothetical protein